MLYVCLVLIFIVALFMSFQAGRIYCAEQCMNNGGFSLGNTDYSCIGIYQKDSASHGLPDVLLDKQDNGAFAPMTLGKLKFLQPVDRQNLSYSDNNRRELFPIGSQYDCVRCYEDAGVIANRMVLCPSCGNKRCPQAQNHRLACTGSNAPNQLDDDLFTMDVPHGVDEDTIHEAYKR